MTPYRADEGLGDVVVVFRKSRARTVADMVIGTFLAALGSAAVGVVFLPASTNVKLFMAPIGALFAALGVWMFVSGVRDRGLWLAFHARGCRYARAGVTTELAFADVTSLRTQHVVERTVTSDRVQWWADRHTLTLRDGTTVEMFCPFDQNVEVLARLHAGTAHLVEGAGRTLAAGQPLERGAITVTPHGVVVKGRTTLFTELRAVATDIDRESDSTSADLVLERVDGQRLRVPLADVLDAHAVEVVVRERMGPRPLT